MPIVGPLCIGIRNQPPTVHSVIANRKTPRKPHEAARAAGMGRAPQDPPSLTARDQNAKNTAPPD